jgi:hypothetical protein
MVGRTTSRRDFIVVSVAASLSMMGCKTQRVTCGGDAQLSSFELEARQRAGYVEHSESEGRACRLCHYWVGNNPGGCGGCKLLHGAIHPDGTCRLFVRSG